MTSKEDFLHRITHTAPRVPHRLDSSRIRNILHEMVIRLHVAALLPRLLFFSDQMPFLGENVHRLLALIRIQVLRSVPVSSRAPETGCCLHRTDSRQYVLCETAQCPSSNSVSGGELYCDMTLDSDTSLPECLQMDQTGFVALQETFSSLSRLFLIGGFDGCGRLLQQAETACHELDDHDGESKLFSYVKQVSRFASEILLNVRKHNARTPYEHCTLRKRSAAIENLEADAVRKNLVTKRQFETQLLKRQEQFKEVGKKIQLHQANMFSHIAQIRKKRKETEDIIASRTEEDSNRQKNKLIKCITNTQQAADRTKESTRKGYGESREEIKKVLKLEDSVQILETALLTKSLNLKGDLDQLTEALNSATKKFNSCKDEEESTGKEHASVSREYNSRIQEKITNEKLRQRKNASALLIQKIWKGYKARQLYQKMKSRKNTKSRSKKTRPSQKT